MTQSRQATDRFSWYSSLKHGGLLIAPSRLAQFYPDDPPPLAPYLADRLRRDLTRLETGSRNGPVSALLDTVLELICDLRPHDGGLWFKGSNVPAEWSRRAITGEIVKPRRIWTGPDNACLPVFVDDEATRLGHGRGRRAVARVIEWLRASDLRVAILTNAHQWRLIYAGLDHDAYAEWDTGLWFEEGVPGPQVTAVQALLSRESVTKRLIPAIQATRQGQSELSSVLGERVRQAVELLIRAHKPDPASSPRDIYLAATRIVMRMVVLLFAEAREDLLPLDNPVYHDSYGLQALRDLLARAAGGARLERLRHRYCAWPRILALFRLIYEGSGHEALPVVRYGGELFRPGDREAKDPLRHALAAFESLPDAPNDATVYQLLDLLCTSPAKVRQGRSATWVNVPVDFSDLSSAYIGILYEGLLDFELRRADGIVIFLNVGDEPALPLNRLEGMNDAELKSLVEKFKKSSRPVIGGEEGGEEGEAEADEEAEEAEEEAEEEEIAGEAIPIAADAGLAYEAGAPEGVELDQAHQAREQVRAWARRASTAGGLVSRRATEEDLKRTADALIARTILPGEWYLVRWGGTRKGSGTFYTRPELAVPTVQRTLRPLAYHPPKGADGRPDEDAPASAWTPKKPEEILALKVCDPSCGSGSFLVASLRFLTDALLVSLHHHQRVRAQGERTLVTLAEGRPGGESLAEELLPCRPDDPDFEPRLRARLKRYVVERSIYGVDLDPLAVELARLTLWVETMDRALPFSFLDHKIRCGNSLVGCWFNHFRDYPALAWEREGGDKGHSNGVHFKQGEWTKKIKEYRTKTVKPALAKWIGGVASIFEGFEEQAPESLHDEAVDLIAQTHDLPVHETEERARFYREKIVGNEALMRLKEVFDTWCALWFWPADRLEDAPLPKDLARPSDQGRAIVAELAGSYRFFHWEIEFADVFARPGSGFDAVVGNPPWEIQKPSSKEFFSNIDPLYRTYGKQDALVRQGSYFEKDVRDEREWLTYCARFKALSNYCRNAASPFGDGADGGQMFNLGAGSEEGHKRWRAQRASKCSYADPAHPFRWQGSADINTYKMFLEAAHALLRDGGQIGLIVPSGIYTDKGTTDLRKLLLTRCRWRWLFGFENRDKIFDIHRSFKFCPVIIEKGGETDAVRAAFMRRDLADWEEGEKHVLPYGRRQVERFSPRTFAILELRNRRDLEILEKIYANSVLLGDTGPDGWGIKYSTEFHMTNDSHLFHPRPWWEDKGYRPDEYGRWLGPDGEVALPLYQGVMIHQYDFSYRAWVSGAGNRAKWEPIPWTRKVIRPQFLMAEKDYVENPGAVRGIKIGFRDIARNTDERTMIAAAIPDLPCGNTIGVLSSNHPQPWVLLACLNSLPFDWVLRQRLGGTHLNWYVVEELPVLQADRLALDGEIRSAVEALCFSAQHFGRESLLTAFLRTEDPAWRALDRTRWATSAVERQRIRATIDAVIARMYGLDRDDLQWILRDCDHPAERLRDSSFTRTFSAVGFWRVDREEEPAKRLTVAAMAAMSR